MREWYLLGKEWVETRFPAKEFWNDHLVKYYAPKNFNFWYYFGSLAMLVLVIQLVTGIFLAMNYKPTASTAFASVEYIMRDVNWGWLIRYRCVIFLYRSILTYVSRFFIRFISKAA